MSDSEDLKQMIALSRQRSVSFGFCLGKETEDSVLLLHRDKPPEAMGLRARQAGETAKVVYGTLSTRGREVSLRLETKPLPRLTKRVKGYLKSQGMAVRVKLADPAEPAPAKDDADESAPEPEEKAQPGWEAVREQVATKAAALSREDAEAGRKITQILEIADRHRSNGKQDKAQATLIKVLKALDRRA